MNFDDILNWEYSQNQMPQFSKPTPLPQFSNDQVSPADIVDRYSTVPIQRFMDRRQQQPQPVQVVRQSPVVQEFPSRFQQKKGIGMFLQFIIIGAFFGLAISLLGNSSLLATIGESFMSGIRSIGSFFA